ncbi:VWA domain-containing protein [Streptomyces sp. 8N706]|uniref:VWA domain-containing protein n=1 Tax=Streptomyces sp. 8N706 TaxID=3457416 RepID=UPI003FD231B1
MTEGGFEPLKYVERNLKDLASVLSEGDRPDGKRGIIPQDAITVLASPSQRKWLKELKRVGEETTDLLFFYFAGHGYRDPFDNQLYLMTQDADLDVNPAVAWSHVLKTLERTHFRHAVFLLDCCNSGVAVEGRGAGQTGHYTLSSALPTKTQPSEGIKVDQGPPRSRFTHEVIRAMEQVGPDSPELTMQELYDRLYAAARTWPVNLGDDFGDGWGPKGGSSGDGPDIVIARFTPHENRPVGEQQDTTAPPPVPPPRQRTPTGPEAGAPAGAPVLRWPADRWKTVTAGAAALLLAIGILLYPGQGADSHAMDCLPPLELRVMTGIETHAAVSRAVTAYMGSADNRVPLGKDDRAPGNCRRANFTVYEAGTGPTVDAFGATAAWAGHRDSVGGTAPQVVASAAAGGPCPAASGSSVQQTGAQGKDAATCFDPLQDVGPQPDLLVAGSSTELGRIGTQLERAPGPAEVVKLGSAGYSPLVLAVPASLEKKLEAQGVQRTGTSWDTLLAAMEEVAPTMPLLRPDPATSSAGLLHTVGLYEASDGLFAGGKGADAKGVEELLRGNGAPAPASDADSLLCAFDKGERGHPRLGKAAALVSEKAVADFNLGTSREGSACGNSKPADEKSRFLAYYPRGVPALDMPLAQVRWKGAEDTDRRTAAIRQFRAWLTGKGSGVFLGGLVRGVEADGWPAPPGGAAWQDTRSSGVVGDVSVVTETADGRTADTVVEQYTKTRVPGQVLFLVDVSGSMAWGGKPAMADAALRRSLRRLGPEDTYGIWSYPKSADHPDQARTEIEPGTPGDDRAKALAWVDSLSTRRMSSSGAAVYEVVERALRETSGEKGRPLIVLITDGDDRPEGDSVEDEAQALGREQGADDSTRALVLSVRLDGCTKEIRRFENPDRTGCFSGRADQAAEELAEQVANQVRGGTSDDAS